MLKSDRRRCEYLASGGEVWCGDEKREGKGYTYLVIGTQTLDAQEEIEMLLDSLE